MIRPTIQAALACLAAGSAVAQVGPGSASPGYEVGSAHAMLMSASPCFTPAEEAKLMELLQAALARVFETPEGRESYYRGMTLTQQQQRYIPRSDPTACNQIRNFLQYLASMQ